MIRFIAGVLVGAAISVFLVALVIAGDDKK